MRFVSQTRHARTKADGMRKTVLITLLSVILIPLASLQAQKYYVVKGQIYDVSDKMTLPQAQVAVVGASGLGAVADIDGNYTLAVDRPEFELNFRYLGYQDKKVKVQFSKGEEVKVLNVGLDTRAQEMQEVKIRGERLKRDGKTSIQTMEVVGVESLVKNNVTTLDRALKGVAGLAIVDNEPQMRGGSGFSSGMGSRVMLLLDDMPMLRADAGRPAWNLVSMDDVEQIDVLKGAASVLYGSAAINGAINVHTKYASSSPISSIKLYAGIYEKPDCESMIKHLRYKETDWNTGEWSLVEKDEKVKDYSWTRGCPIKTGVSLSHSRRLAKWWDFSANADYAYDDGYRLGPEQNPGDRVEPAEKRVRASMGNRFHINDRWTFSLNANFMYSDNRMYNFWANALDGKYRPFGHMDKSTGKWSTTLSHFKDVVVLVDPHLKYVSPKGGVHELDNRYMFSNNNVINITGQDARSQSVYNTYRYRKTFEKAADLDLTVGVSNQYTYSVGEVFSGRTDTIGAKGSHTSDNLAVFVRLEKPFLKEKNLKLELGGRLENCFVDSWHEMSPVFQLGLNYAVTKSGTIFRLSAGQGYRAATIGEKFITTKVGMYGFYPNPDLKSEKSLNMEFGIRQYLKSNVVEGYIDVAAFHQYYWNYIEFFMGPWNPVSTASLPDLYGFKFFNTGRATISGVEASFMTEWKILENLQLQLQANYTYSLPVCKETDKVYTSTVNPETGKGKDYKYSNSSSNTEGNILKYRIQHMAKFDLDVKFCKYFSIGGGIQYMSAMKNVDGVFIEMDANIQDDAHNWVRDNFRMTLPFEGMDEFMKQHAWGSLVLDLRASININRFTVSFVVNNLLNAEYSLRPLYIEAPRTYTLQITYRFQDINPVTWFRRNKADVARL